VKELSDRLAAIPIKAIYTSPLERAMETAHAVASPHLLNPTVCENLGEMHFGKWDGMTFDQLNQKQDWVRFNTVRSIVRPPGGELMVEVQSRMVGEVERLRSQHPGETLGIVSHADPIKALVAHYLGCSLDLLPRLEINPASVTTIRFVDDVPTLLSLNCMDASKL